MKRIRPVFSRICSFSSYSRPNGFGNEKPSKLGLQFANILNQSFVSYPRETIVSVIGLEIASVYGTYCVLSSFTSLNALISVDFALAFALSRPIRRIRLPLDLFFTPVVARIFPSFPLVQVSTLGKLFPAINTVKEAQKNKYFSYMFESIKTVIDKYGLSFFVASRYMGVMVVTLLWICIKYGMDVQDKVIHWFNIEPDKVQSYGDLLGSWAASVTFSALFYPFTIVGGALAAKQLHRLKIIYLRRNS